MSTPTPRTDAAWAASFSPEKPGFNMRDLASTLERELADQAARFHDELARRQETVRANNKLNKKELDQLRAEVERLKTALSKSCDDEREMSISEGPAHGVCGLAVELMTRAERAEAEVARLKADGAASAFIDMACRASHAEAELATERARLDWLETPSGMDWQWEPERLTVSRASIDAAMKEDAK